MKKVGYGLIISILSVITSYNIQAQQVLLTKSTTSISGGALFSKQYKISLNQTIGQSSLTSSFSNTEVVLLQGFQHQYVRTTSSNNLPLKFTIYPNPTTGRVNLECLDCASLLPFKVMLVSMEGKIIQEDIISSERELYSIDYLNIQKGVYIIKAANSNKAFFTKLLMLR